MKRPRRKGYDSGGFVKNPDQGYIPVDSSQKLSSDSIGKGVMGGAGLALQAGSLIKGVTGGGSGGGAAGGKFPLNKGGKVKHTAGPKVGRDDGMISAQRGEYVVRKSAVQKLGTKALNTINQGKLPAKKR